MSDLIKDIGVDSFDTDVLKADVPVLVDYWAPWCGPCKMISPLLESIAADFEGKVQIVKVNIDDNKELAARYSVRGIPTLMLFRNGNIEGTKVGAVSKGQLEDFINSNI